VTQTFRTMRMRLGLAATATLSLVATSATYMPRAAAEGGPSGSAEDPSSDLASKNQPKAPSFDPGPNVGATEAGAPSDEQRGLAVQLRVELADGCGTSARFLERLTSRLGSFRFVEQGATHIVRARVVANPNGSYRATVTLQFPDRHVSGRVVVASDCSDAIEALALITAVALDPTGADGSPSPHPRRKGADASPPRVAAKPSPAADGPITLSRATAEPTPSTENRRVVLGVAFEPVVYRGISPNWLTGFDLSLRLMQRRAGAFAPSMRLSLGYAAERGIAVHGGVADFALASAQLDLCPGQALWPAAELRGCGLVHSGFIRANGRATEAPETHVRPILGLGAALELVLLPHVRWGIPVRFQLFFPTTRDTFAFDPEAFHRVSGVLFGASAGLEARFR
jgi:hypothetical protein